MNSAGDGRPCDGRPCDGRPEDLSVVLEMLTSIDGDPAPEHLIYLRQHVWNLAHGRLPANDTLRIEMDSEDLAQDVLLQLVQHAQEFRGRTWVEFFGFVRGLVNQQKVDRARHHGRQKRTVDKVELAARAVTGDTTTTPSVIIGGREEKAKLRKLIEELPDGLRRTLELRLEGRGYEEIARISAISTENARQRISRAVGVLKERWRVGGG